VVRVYRSQGRWRVVVDGLAHFDVDGPSEAEPKARQVILDRLRSYLPDRHPPLPEADLESFQLYDLLLVRVDVLGTGSSQTPLPTPGVSPSVSAPTRTSRRVTGSRP
jgi:hypothetical protein